MTLADMEEFVGAKLLGAQLSCLVLGKVSMRGRIVSVERLTDRFEMTVSGPEEIRKITFETGERRPIFTCDREKGKFCVHVLNPWTGMLTVSLPEPDMSGKGEPIVG